MKLSLWQKTLYSFGSLGTALSYQSFVAFIQFLYIVVFGLDVRLMGIGWSIYGIWNAINDPLAGYWSDNTKTRWGRRIPWIAATFIPVGLFFYLLWVPPQALIDGDDLYLFIYFMTIVIIFDTLWTIIVMNWTALFPEMITEEKERASVSGLRQVFGVIGLLVGVALPPILVGANWSGRANMAMWFGIITSLSFGLSLLGSKENPAIQHEKQPPLIPAMVETFKRSSFRWFLTANLFKEFIFSITTATIPFWALYVLNIKEPTTLLGATLDVGTQNSILLGSIFVMTLPGIPIWTWVAQKLGARRGWQASQVTFALSMLFLFMTSEFATATIATSIVGLSLAGLLVFPDLVIADVIDEDETIIGARREGMFFGINGFIIRFAFTLQGITFATVFTLTRFVNNPDQTIFQPQPEAAIWGIRIMVAIVPVIASAVVIWALQMYPLHSEQLKTLRSRIAGIRDAASPAS
jgi:glycoside/pentoside/hexuronide:cation symporter, GPH family